LYRKGVKPPFPAPFDLKDKGIQMLRLRFTSATAVFCAFFANGAQAAVAHQALVPGYPQTYVVQPGDTLWGISGRFLHEPWRWPELMDANPGIGDPRRLQIGDTIRIETSGGVARGRVSRRHGIPVVKLSPRVRETPLDTGIPPIPESMIFPFLTRPYVADKSVLDRAPYVLDFVGEHITGGAGDEIYARGIEDPSVRIYDVVRPGEAYEDPDSGEILGYEAALVGQARVERYGDITKLRIQEMALEALAGDRLIPVEPYEVSDFYPQPAPQGSGGRIISVMRGVSQIGIYDVVVINRGSSDGLKPGSVYKIFQGGDKTHDPIAREQWQLDWPYPYGQPPVVTWPDSEVRLPLEESGLLMIFRTFDRVSFGLVMQAQGPIHVLDRIRPPPPPESF